MRSTRRRLTTALAIALAAIIGFSEPALACGGLIAPNGSVRLLRTSTLVAHVDGVEHYVTSFSFAGDAESFGSVIPLPGEPTEVERAGDWTLQRLAQEVSPALEESAVADGADVLAGASREVEVLQEVQIDSLDITIVRGGGPEVADWAEEQGFQLDEESGPMFEFYAERSPYFMAARFDAAAAAADGFTEGDGVPVHLEIPTDEPWVPLHILSLGKPADEVVEADVFLLTEQRPDLLGDEGLRINRSEAASDFLLDDLRSDENSEWIPEKAWFTHIEVAAAAGELDTDLAIGVNDEPSPVDAGLERPSLTVGGAGESAAGPFDPADPDSGNDWLLGIIAVLTGVAVVSGSGLLLVRLGRK